MADNDQALGPVAQQGAATPLYGPMGQVLPGPTIAVTSPSSSTTRVKPTAGYMQSIEDQKAAMGAEASALDVAARAEADAAFQQKLVFDQELQNEKTRQAARAQAIADWNKRIGEAQKQLSDRIEKASADPTGYWEDRTEGERTRARIGVWLSAFGAGITGGDNLAIKTINDNIERDLKIKQAKSEKMFRLAEQSRGLLSDAYRQKAEELGDMDAQRTAAWQNVAKEMESIKLGFLPAQKRSEADQKIALVSQKAAQSLQDANKNLETRVTSESGHTTTTMPMNGGKDSRPRTSNDVQNFSMMESLGEIGRRQLELMQDPSAVPTPEMMREYEQNENILINRAEKEQEGGAPSVFWSKVLRALPDWMPGSIPKQAYPKGANPKQREYMDNDAVLGHFRAQKLGGQTAVANARTLHTIMAPAKGMGGENQADAVRKSAQQAKEFVDAAQRASEISVAGEREAKLHPEVRAERSATPAATSAPTPAMTPLQMAKMARARLSVDPNDKTAIEVLKHLESMDVSR